MKPSQRSDQQEYAGGLGRSQCYTVAKSRVALLPTHFDHFSGDSGSKHLQLAALLSIVAFLGIAIYLSLIAALAE